MNRWTKYTFSNGKTAKNRIVVPPMASQTADQRGMATETTFSHYERLTESGAGIIFVEYSHIHQSGKGEPNQLGVNLDEQISGLLQISNIIKKTNALAGLQIVHVGGKGDSKLTGSPLLGPSEIATPMRNSTLETPMQATFDQIKELKNWYIDSARRSVLSGFDILEIHAAHGYGMNQWLSPITNKRADKYGGSIKGRSLLLREVILAIKSKYPSLLLAVRLPAQDYLLDGLIGDDMIWVTQELEKLGVDLLDVSSGIGGWRRPRGKIGQGYLVDDASLFKNNVSLPVIGVGGIKTGEYIDRVLLEKKVDFTAVGREILENPAQWRQQNLTI